MTVPAALTRVEGPTLTLRLIAPKDADYVHALRTNPAYNSHMSQVHGSVADQRRWIEDYKSREAALGELYYVIARKDGTRCGLVRLYNIDAESFTWGSWILDHNKTRKAALESAVLSFGVGFNGLGRSQADVAVRVGNLHAQAFYQRFGMTEIRRDPAEVFYTYPRSRFDADQARYLECLERERKE